MRQAYFVESKKGPLRAGILTLPMEEAVRTNEELAQIWIKHGKTRRDDVRLEDAAAGEERMFLDILGQFVVSKEHKFYCLEELGSGNWFLRVAQVLEELGPKMEVNVLLNRDMEGPVEKNLALKSAGWSRSVVMRVIDSKHFKVAEFLLGLVEEERRSTGGARAEVLRRFKSRFGTLKGGKVFVRE